MVRYPHEVIKSTLLKIRSFDKPVKVSVMLDVKMKKAVYFLLIVLGMQLVSGCSLFRKKNRCVPCPFNNHSQVMPVSGSDKPA